MKDKDFDFDKTGVRGDINYRTFGCKVFKESPDTPDRLRPDVTIYRDVHTDGRFKAPDGRRIEYWGFADPKSKNSADRNAPYPSPLIRVRAGQVVHTVLRAKKGPHTIHHHGINPTTFNDGVGHVSFEAGEYTYQWCPKYAGTAFYHCHRNTPLHFEMGMFGVIIVDGPEGPGVLTNGQRYQVEKVWAADDMDPRWHDRIASDGHDAGLCGEDVGLNRFEPKYFLLSGVFNNRTMTDSRTVVNAQLGETILIRLLNASYSILKVTLELDAMIIGTDTQALGSEPWGRPFLLPAGTPLELPSARRYGLLLTPQQRGSFGARMEFLHWITGAVQDSGRGVINSKIIVS